MKRGKSNKKAAIEMSMTTIIVIVLGVTLLILGLIFVRTIFEKVTSIAGKGFTIADKELQERMGSSDKIYIPGVEFEIDSGKSITITIGVQNFGDETTPSKFKLNIIPGDNSGKKEWFILPPEGTLKIGETKGFPLKIKLPKGAPPGKSYTFTISILKNNQEYESQAVIVTVKEK